MPKKRPIAIGDAVTVVQSWHSDVPPGAVGTVTARFNGGYAVDVTGRFSDARGDGRIETRCLFFSRREVKKLV